MNRLSILFLIFLLFNNCSINSINKEQRFWGKDKPEVKKPKKILSEKIRVEKEFNSTLEINFSLKNNSKKIQNTQNDIGNQLYEGVLKKIGRYKFSKLNNFEYIDVKPIFYGDKVIFFDNKGTITFYDEFQKKKWKKNFYSKAEKKLRPRLNFAIKNNILIVTDDVAKYYTVDVETGEVIWIKNNSVPFNSDIKFKGDSFYVVDYKNIVRSFSIKNGSELWNFNTEETLTRSNTKTSIAIDKQNIYFNNSLGDITALSLTSGELIWQLPTQSNNISENAFRLSSSQIVINKNLILFSNNKNEFYSVDRSTGLINWTNKISSNVRPIVIDKFIITVSDKGYLYVINKKNGDILRINDLYKDYKPKKRIKISPTGFIIAENKIYLTNNDGKLIVADLNTGTVSNILKIASKKISQPFVHNNNIFIIKNGSIIKYN